MTNRIFQGLSNWTELRDGIKEGMVEAHEITLRDQFIKAALQGLLSTPPPQGVDGDASLAATIACDIADAVMKERAWRETKRGEKGG